MAFYHPKIFAHIKQDHFAKVCSDLAALKEVAPEVFPPSNFSDKTLPQFKARNGEFDHGCPPPQEMAW